VPLPCSAVPCRLSTWILQPFDNRSAKAVFKALLHANATLRSPQVPIRILYASAYPAEWPCDELRIRGTGGQKAKPKNTLK
jgi:hypothetical protein